MNLDAVNKRRYVREGLPNGRWSRRENGERRKFQRNARLTRIKSRLFDDLGEREPSGNEKDEKTNNGACSAKQQREQTENADQPKGRKGGVHSLYPMLKTKNLKLFDKSLYSR